MSLCMMMRSSRTEPPDLTTCVTKTTVSIFKDNIFTLIIIQDFLIQISLLIVPKAAKTEFISNFAIYRDDHHDNCHNHRENTQDDMIESLVCPPPPSDSAINEEVEITMTLLIIVIIVIITSSSPSSITSSKYLLIHFLSF